MTPPVGENTALFLDIDGTLLDLARTPDLVKVPGALVAALRSLARQLDGALALVSGRSLESIDRLFAPFCPAAIGAHGGEMRGVDGQVTRMPSLPERIRALFGELAQRTPGLLLEDKGCALALHYRLAPEAAGMLQAAMEENTELFAGEKVQVIHGKAVFEARPFGVDKGAAVTALAKQKPFAGRDILFGGDDTTDMDVFRILPALGGQGFSVGKPFAGAAYLFASPRTVRQWLTRLAKEGVA